MPLFLFTGQHKEEKKMKKFRLLKRVCAGALTVGMCLSLIACGTQSNSDDTSASGSTAGTGDKVKVGIAIQTLKANVYTMMQKSAFIYDEVIVV